MRIVLVMMLLLLVSGCATYTAPGYSPELGHAAGLSGGSKAFSVVTQKPLFADSGSIACRGAGFVKPPSGQTFTHYISAALRSELAAAGRLSDDGEPISMQLTKVDFATTLGATNWYIDALYTVEGEPVAVSTTYNDRSSYFGNVACSNMARYLPKAVAAHLEQLYGSPAFIKAMRPRSSSVDPSLVDRLRELEEARAKGLVTEQEYQAKRKQIIRGF